jgi:hypothetical protein
MAVPHKCNVPSNRSEANTAWGKLLLQRRKLCQCPTGPVPVTLYRLAFGQPRQDDPLTLLDQVRDEIAPEALSQLQISLRPD